MCWEDCDAEKIAAEVLADYPDPRHGKAGARLIDPPPEGFDVFCHGLMASLVEGPLTRWQYWHSVFREGDALMDDPEVRMKGITDRETLPPGSWLRGFPHTHGSTTGRTVIMGIQAPESGGELVIYPEGGEEPLANWSVMPGVGIVLPDKSLLHGVRPVVGDRERIILICTAIRKEDG